LPPPNVRRNTAANNPFVIIAPTPDYKTNGHSTTGRCLPDDTHRGGIDRLVNTNVRKRRRDSAIDFVRYLRDNLAVRPVFRNDKYMYTVVVLKTRTRARLLTASRYAITGSADFRFYFCAARASINGRS